MDNIQDIAKKTLAHISCKTALTAEVFIGQDKSTSVSVLEQKIEEVKTTQESGLSIRLIGNDRMGFAYTADMSDEGIALCIDQAIENHAHNAKDPYWSMPATHSCADAASLDMYDTALEKLELKDKIDIAMQIEQAAKRHDLRVKKSEHVSYRDSISEIYLLNSAGLASGYRSSSCGGMADVVAELGSQMEAGSGMSFAVHLKGFDAQTVGIEAATQACQMLGAIVPKTMKTDIVFSPEVGISFLSVLAEIFLASSIQKGRSLLLHKLGKQIASSKVTLVDNGLLPGHLGTAPCDGEGTACQKTVLIEQGVLKQYLYSLYTANKEKKLSTGNAHRGGAFSLPDIQPSNFYIEPGTLSAKQIIKNLHSGILVTKVMGMHTADPVSGDFSIGIAGLMIKNGVIAEPIRGGAIAGNLLDLLHSIETIGNDLRFLPYHGNVGCPTLHIKHLSVSGK